MNIWNIQFTGLARSESGIPNIRSQGTLWARCYLFGCSVDGGGPREWGQAAEVAVRAPSGLGTAGDPSGGASTWDVELLCPWQPVRISVIFCDHPDFVFS